LDQLETVLKPAIVDLDYFLASQCKIQSLLQSNSKTLAKNVFDLIHTPPDLEYMLQRLEEDLNEVKKAANTSNQQQRILDDADSSFETCWLKLLACIERLCSAYTFISNWIWYL